MVTTTTKATDILSLVTWSKTHPSNSVRHHGCSVNDKRLLIHTHPWTNTLLLYLEPLYRPVKILNVVRVRMSNGVFIMAVNHMLLTPDTPTDSQTVNNTATRKIV